MRTSAYTTNNIYIFLRGRPVKLNPNVCTRGIEPARKRMSELDKHQGSLA